MHVYLVEVDNYARQIVARCVQGLGHRVTLLPEPAGLLGALGRGPKPDSLIIADLPPARCRDVGKVLWPVHRRYPTIPVVLRTSSEVLPVADAVHAGVYGYLSKPFRPAELELMMVRLAEGQASQSFQDAASGLYHRSGFAVLARQQLKAARRTRTEMVLVRAEVDGMGLKQTERAIGSLARVVLRTFRDADMAGRVAGTDCGVLLVNAAAGQADIALSRLRKNLKEHNARAGEQPLLQVRLGLAHFDPDHPCSLEELLARAEATTCQTRE